MKNPLTTPAPGLYANICTHSLLWECQSRLNFMVLLTQDGPELLAHDAGAIGFNTMLNDARELLSMAITELEAVAADTLDKRAAAGAR